MTLVEYPNGTNASSSIGTVLHAPENRGIFFGRHVDFAALMELQASRAKARVDPEGRPVLLLDQDRARWDRLLIRRRLAARRTEALAGQAGPYQLQAAIAACHARAATPAETD